MKESGDAASHGIERFLTDRGSGLLRAAWCLTGDDQHAEVATMLGIGEGTVKKYAHRGCAALQGSVHLADEEASR